jgi:hypothetical protein
MDRFLERMVDRLTPEIDRRFSTDFIGRRAHDPLAVKLRDMAREDLDDETRERLCERLYACIERLVALTESLESETTTEEEAHFH